MQGVDKMATSLEVQVENTLLKTIEQVKGSILVVDDEPAIGVVMGIILKLHG